MVKRAHPVGIVTAVDRLVSALGRVDEAAKERVVNVDLKGLPRDFRSTSSLTRSAQRRRVYSGEWDQRLIVPAPWARP